MTDKPDGKRWRWGRGIVAAIGLSLACQLAATLWIVLSLSGNVARIPKPYNQLWYAAAINIPAAILWCLYFARPCKHRILSTCTRC